MGGFGSVIVLCYYQYLRRTLGWSAVRHFGTLLRGLINFFRHNLSPLWSTPCDSKNRYQCQQSHSCGKITFFCLYSFHFAPMQINFHGYFSKITQLNQFLAGIRGCFGAQIVSNDKQCNVLSGLLAEIFFGIDAHKKRRRQVLDTYLRLRLFFFVLVLSCNVSFPDRHRKIKLRSPFGKEPGIMLSPEISTRYQLASS